jgi:hypothetical protein
VSKHTIYAWKAKYGGMTVSEAQEAKQLRDEKHEVEKAGGRSEPGQRDAEGTDRKKRMELVNQLRTRTGCGASMQRASAGFAG